MRLYRIGAMFFITISMAFISASAIVKERPLFVYVTWVAVDVLCHFAQHTHTHTHICTCLYCTPSHHQLIDYYSKNCGQHIHRQNTLIEQSFLMWSQVLIVDKSAVHKTLPALYMWVEIAEGPDSQYSTLYQETSIWIIFYCIFYNLISVYTFET